MSFALPGARSTMAASTEPPPKKVAFLSTVAPGDTPRLETMFGYALVAQAMGYRTKVFLALDSALVVKKPIFEKLDTKLRERITECIEAGVELDVCEASAQTFNIRTEDLIPGAKPGGIASFLVYAEEADVQFSWS